MRKENTIAKRKGAEKATRLVKVTASSSLPVVLAGLARENASRRKKGENELSYGNYVAKLERR